MVLGDSDVGISADTAFRQAGKVGTNKGLPGEQIWDDRSK
jgi:hypothetical protein